MSVKPTADKIILCYYEITRYKKFSIACIENDTVGCYERIVNSVVLLFLRKLGVPENTLISLASTWKKVLHKIKTIYGISDESYTNNLGYFLYGPGQGSTIGPIPLTMHPSQHLSSRGQRQSHPLYSTSYQNYGSNCRFSPWQKTIVIRYYRSPYRPFSQRSTSTGIHQGPSFMAHSPEAV